jgi:hypothetical protein
VGSTLGGTQTVAAVNGVASFTNLTLAGTAGTPYTLTFASGTLTPAAQTNVTVTAGTATKGVLTTQPSGAVNGVAVSGAPVVQLEDANGNYVSSLGVSVVATITSGNGTLGGTTTVTTNASGVATFSNLVITGTAGSYTLTFTPASLAAAASNPFTLAVGAASKLAITTAPVGGPCGASLATQPIVKVEDSGGNVVTGSSAVITVTSSTGSTVGGTQAGGLAATSGVATFTNLTLTGTINTNYTLTFASGTLTPTTSGSLTVTVGAATKAALTTQPSGAVNGVPVSGPPVVQLRDSGNNNVAAGSVNVVATIGSGSGTLSGATTVATNSSGVATFSNLIITGTVGSYTLTFTPTALTPTTSSSFTLTVGAATQIAMNAGNNQAAAPGTAVAIAPSVLVRDSGGNPVTGVSVTFTAATGGGTVTGSPATTNSSGIAAVGSWGLGSTVGANTLTATSAGLTGSPVTFNATSITVGTQYGGGVVAYILQSGDPGYVAGQTHGLIAAPSDQSSAIIWALPGFQASLVGGTSTALGTGSTNTTKIVAQNSPGSGYAAGLAKAYAGGGFSDWYLPSLAELNDLYNNRAAIGGFAKAAYWSSSEGDGYDAWLVNFANGSQADYVKSLTNGVRAVRSF